MKKLLMYIFSLILIANASLSCKRQTIYDPLLISANIPLVIDWSKSRVDPNRINNVSVSFYPEDGTDPIVGYSSDPYLVTMRIPEGVFDIIVHNEIGGNIRGVEVENSEMVDEYSMKSAEVDTSKLTMFYNAKPNDRFIKEVEAVAAWGYRGFRVTPEMIEYTRTRTFEELLSKLKFSSESRNRTKSVSATYMLDMTKSFSEMFANADVKTRSVAESLEDLNGIQPLPRTCIYEMELDFINMNSMQYMECVIDGFVDGVKVYAGEKIIPQKNNCVCFKPSTSTLIYKSGSEKDGSVKYAFLNFGHKPYDANAKYELHVNVILNSGEKHPLVFDVTDDVHRGESNAHIKIQVGDKFQNGTADIELPANSGGGFGVGDWDDVENVEL